MKSFQKISISIFIIFITSCSFNDSELKENWWKYCGDYYIGDMIDFRSIHTLRNDTIYLKATPKALLISKTESFFGFTDRKIMIESLESNEVGAYCGK